MAEDGWGSWADEVPVARAQAAKRGRWEVEAGTCSSAPRVRPHSAAAGDVTVDDTDALDCGVCYLPLKPPIFQCDVGHVVCSQCCDKLKATGKCPVCRVTTGGYRRCYSMEYVVESVHVRCPNAVHGCTARPAYYDQQNHRRTCAHMPYHCPGEGCGFIGPKTALWDHFSGIHRWPCFNGRAGKQFDSSECTNAIFLDDGFNFLFAEYANDGHGATSTATVNSKYLFLLNVARQPLGRAISVLCIHPRAISAKCELSYEGYGNIRRGGDQVMEHYQKSRFRVACTDLSCGLPTPDSCFQFVVPDSVADDIDHIDVTAHIVIE